MDYRREVDGLRALAVVPVILFHAGFHSFRGGFVGVDVFFVISGYLITSIIVSDLEQGRFSIVNFYERRARRILPALFLVMLACLPFAWLWLLPDDVVEFSRSLMAVSAFSSNILFWQEAGYFATAAELKPLLHTWSLAVEEQHYVLFPLFLLFTWKLGRRSVVGLLAAVFALSLAIAQWGSVNKPEAAFFLLPTRGWELLVGAFTAFYLGDPQRREIPATVKEVGGVAGILLLAYAVVSFSDQTPFPGYHALVPTLGTALLILCATDRTYAGRLLGTPLLVGVGLISYSAYLWHQPILAFARHRSVEEPAALVRGVLAASSLALAFLSWKYVETPFRDKKRIGRRGVFRFALAGSLFFLTVGGLQLAFKDEYERQWIARQPKEVRDVMKLIEVSKREPDAGLAADGTHGDGPCRFNVPRLTPEVERRILGCRAKYPAGVAVIGDSHGVGLFGVAISGSREPFIIGVTQLGCRPHSPAPQCQYDGFLSFVERHPGVFARVIYEQAAFYLLRTEDIEGRRDIFSSLPIDQEVTGVSINGERLALVHEYLQAVSRHVPVLWFGSRLEPHIGDNLILRLGCDYPYHLRPRQREMFDSLDARMAGLVRNDARIAFASQNALMRYTFPADFMNCRTLYWTDGDHLSAAGERRFGGRVDVVALARRMRR